MASTNKAKGERKNMKAYSVKQIGSEEYSNCSEIWNKQKFQYTENMNKEQIKTGNRDVFTLTVEDQYIAMCDLVYDKPEYETVPDKRLYLPRLVVKKNYRGEGYGKAILQYILSIAKEKGYSEIVLGVDCDNTVALNLYKKLGFSIYELDEDKDGKFYKMIKFL